MKIPERLKKVIPEEELADIKKEFDSQVNIAVESALHQYDEDACKRIDTLVAQITETYKVKITALLEKRKEKEKVFIENIKASHEKALTTEADKFKTVLARNIEQFVESKISKIIDYTQLKEAAKNNTALIVLEGLRKQLGVDSALMKESISVPMLEAREKMKGAMSYIKKLKEANQRLNESLKNSESNLLIENRVSVLPEEAANHMRRMLKGKDIKFINENYSYILDLYKQGKNKKRSLLAEQAFQSHGTKKQRIVEPKRSRDLIPEAKNNLNKGEDSDLIEEIVAEMNDIF